MCPVSWRLLLSWVVMRCHELCHLVLSVWVMSVWCVMSWCVYHCRCAYYHVLLRVLSPVVFGSVVLCCVFLRCVCAIVVVCSLLPCVCPQATGFTSDQCNAYITSCLQGPAILEAFWFIHRWSTPHYSARHEFYFSVEEHSGLGLGVTRETCKPDLCCCTSIQFN